MSGPSSSPVSSHQSAPAPHPAPEKVITPADQIISPELHQQPRTGTPGISRGSSLEQRSGGTAGTGAGGVTSSGGGGGVGGGGGGGSYHHQNLHHIHHHPSSQVPTVTTTATSVGVTPNAPSGPPPSYSRSVDTPDTGWNLILYIKQ